MNANAVNNNRIAWIDVAKGLGLALVIFGHLLYSGSWEGVNRAIYSFHMPMYFILSGWLLKGDRMTFPAYAARRAKRLLLPAAAFQLISLPVWAFYSKNAGTLNIKELLLNLFYVKGEVFFVSPPVWFLICIFQVMLLVRLLRLGDRGLPVKAAAAAAGYLCAWLVYSFLPVPWFGIDKLLLAFGFYMTGSVLCELEKRIPRGAVFAAVAVSIPAWVLSGIVFNTKVSMYGFSLGSFWLFVLSGISGSILWFALSRLVSRVGVFAKWGDMTVLVMGTHYLAVVVLRNLFTEFGFAHTIKYDLVSLVITVVALFAYIPVTMLVNRFLPVFNGKSYVRRSSPNGREK